MAQLKWDSSHVDNRRARMILTFLEVKTKKIL